MGSKILLELINDIVDLFVSSSVSKHAKLWLNIQDTTIYGPCKYKIVKIGRITFNRENVIGKGIEGTVYRGTFGKYAHAAIKEYTNISSSTKARLRERVVKVNESLLNVTCANIVRFYYFDENKFSFYLCMELCDCNLEVFICQYPKEVPKDGFKQILEGLKVLHNNKFLHRDLKPSNVLVKKEKTEEGKLIVLKLSDFSLAKETDDEMSVISGLYIGTEGWIPPEIHQGTEVKPSNIVVNASADIFACGMLGYYVVSGGNMVYNSQQDINRDLSQDKADYSFLNDPTAEELVRAMTCRDESKRPNAKMCLKHPYHWDFARVLEYFKVVNDTIRSVEEPSKQMSNELNKNPHQVFHSGWKSRLTPQVKNELFTAPRSSTRPNYNEFILTDLIRAIRNTNDHFLQMKHVHNELGDNKIKLHAYWTGLFPHLLIYTYNTLKPLTMYGELQFFY